MIIIIIIILCGGFVNDLRIKIFRSYLNVIK